MFKLISDSLLIPLVVALLFISEAQAATSDTLSIKVTVSPVLSVNITEGELSFGAVAVGSTTLSSGAVTVTNNSSGVKETYSLSLVNPAGWTASTTAAGVEIYVLNAAFSNSASVINWSSINHALSTTPTACSATKFNGDQTGVIVPYNETRKLWFQFKAPTSTTVSTEQRITFTITAQVGS